MTLTNPAGLLDANDGRVPWRVEGLLVPFVAAGVLAAADVHVARRLCALTGEDDDRVALAVALTVRALRGGSVCLVLAEAPDLVADAETDTEASAAPETLPETLPTADLPWPDLAAWGDAVRASPLVADGPHGHDDRPVRWVDGRVYLDRYWRDELVVRGVVDEHLTDADVDDAALAEATTRLLAGPAADRQRAAVRAAATSRVTVLTGGPGTGKTTTVARLVAALAAGVRGPGLRVGLAAPTGKAAARLQEAVNAEVATLPEADQQAVGRLVATTVHRMLGWRPGASTRFRHDRTHPLPYDLVVVDESSMVSLSLMARIMEALRPSARLVLVGDADQLVSVEAGAVLGDLVEAHPEAVVRLTHVFRYGSALARLAEAIRTGDGEAVVDLLRTGDDAYELVELSEGTGDPETTGAWQRLTDADLTGLRTDVVAAGRRLVTAARAGDASEALAALDAHRLLLAHRTGPFGVAHWAPQAAAWVGEATGRHRPVGGAWPVGEPLLVTKNDRASGLYNGDAGVVVAAGAGGTVVAFGSPDAPRLVAPYRLPEVQPVHAMTVHRAQGSQFARVTVLLPPAGSPLLTRELLYTAVTRASAHVRVVATADAVRTAVATRSRRASGLRAPLD